MHQRRREKTTIAAGVTTALLLLFAPPAFSQAQTHTAVLDFSSGTFQGWGTEITNVSGGEVQMGPRGAAIDPFIATTNVPELLERHAAVTWNGRVYILGGYDPQVYTGARNVVRFATIQSDGSLGPWTTTTPMPELLYDHAAAVWNGRIYVMGGWNPFVYTGSRNAVYYATINADGTLGPWSSTTNMPNLRDRHASVAWDGRLYVFGGSNPYGSFGSYRQSWFAPIKADGTLGSWQTTTSMPYPVDQHGATVYNGRVYISGGKYGWRREALNTVWTAPFNVDGTLGSWSTTTGFPSARRSHGFNVLNGELYISGGANYLGNTQLTVYHAPINSDGTVGAWSGTSNLPFAREKHGTVVSGRKLYTTGGYSTWIYSGAILQSDYSQMQVAATYPHKGTFYGKSMDFGSDTSGMAVNYTSALNNGTLSIAISTASETDNVFSQWSPIASGATIPESVRHVAYRLDFTPDTALTATPQLFDITIGLAPTNQAPNAPTLTAPIGGISTNTAQPTLTWTGDDPDGDTLTFDLDIDDADDFTTIIESASGIAGVASNGAFDGSHVPMTLLVDGTYYWRVRGDDGTDTGSYSTTGIFVVDTTAPTLDITNPLDSADIATNLPTISASYNDTGGTGINVGSVKLFVDGVDQSGAATIGAASLSYTPGAVLADGTHIAFVRVADVAGSVSEATSTFVVDTTSPTATSLSPVDGSTLAINLPAITAAYNDAAGTGVDAAGVTIYLDSTDETGSAVITATNLSLTLGAALSDGFHVLTLTLPDIVGNFTVVSSTFRVDATLPSVSITSPLNGSTTNFVQSNIYAVYSNGQSGIDTSAVTITVDGNDVTGSATIGATSLSYTPAVALTEGSHTIVVNVADNAGNPASATSTFNIDATAPNLSIDYPLDGTNIAANSPTVSATYSDPGGSGINIGSVKLFVDGVDQSGAATIGAASLSYTPGTALTDGSHIAFVRVADVAGSVSEATSTFVVDTASPTVSGLSPVEGSTITVNLPAITAAYNDAAGTGVDAAGVTIYLDSSDETGSAVITATNLSLTLGAALPDGFHVLTLTVPDLVGNYIVVSSTFRVDATPPTLNIDNPLDGTDIATNLPAISASYNDAGGTGIDVGSVKLFVDGVDQSGAATIGAASLSYTPGTALADGSHIAFVRVADIAGSVSEATSTFVVDTTSPTATSLSPVDGSTIAINLPVITVAYNDGGGTGVDPAVVAVYLDGVDETASSAITAAGLTLTLGAPLSDAFHVVTVRISDLIGNFTVVSSTFRVDVTQPSVSIPSPLNGSTTNFVQPNFYAVYSNGQSGIDVTAIKITVDGSDVTGSATYDAASLSYTPGVALSEGPHTVIVDVADNAGNTASAASTFDIDATGPNLSIDTPVDGSTIAVSQPAITASYSDPGGLGIDSASVAIFVNGVDQSGAATIGAAALSYTPAAPLLDGTHIVFVSVADFAGNVTEATSTFQTDTNPPTISSFLPLDGTSVSADVSPLIVVDYSNGLSGIDVAGVKLYLDATDVTALAMITSSQATYTPASLTLGAHVATIVVPDNVGLTTTASSTFTAVDLTSPTIVNNVPPDEFTAWYNSGALLPLVDIGFFDTGGSHLDRFEIQATVDPAGGGTPNPDFTAVQTTADFGTTTDALTTPPNWAIPGALFDLMTDGTNYITVRAKDQANNTTDEISAFIVRKDTSPPVIPAGLFFGGTGVPGPQPVPANTTRNIRKTLAE